MIFEPGILNAAHAKGIFLTDLNNDGKIDTTDLNLAVKAKATVVSTDPAEAKESK